MTNPTPHGQVPAIQRFEVVDCIDSKHVPAVIPKPHGPWVRYEDHAAVITALRAQQPAAPPAEQQATKETSGGFHVWRDISTAPKDGSRFVATGHNYGLYSEVRHACVAQWFRGCWMEASDWNETSELKYLTHWMPLPSPPDDVAAPAEQQAAYKAAPGVPLTRDQIREVFMAHGFTVKEGQADLKQYVYDAADALLRAARAPADSVLEDAAQESEYRRGYRHGYEQRDAEVRGALA